MSENQSPELDPIFAKLTSDAWRGALDGIDDDKARAMIVQLFARLPPSERSSLVRQLDENERPWGEPGEVPGEPGYYWVANVPGSDAPNSARRVCRWWLDDEEGWWIPGYLWEMEAEMGALAEKYNLRFCSSPTPGAP
jgi:hypothetical protein